MCTYLSCGELFDATLVRLRPRINEPRRAPDHALKQHAGEMRLVLYIFHSSHVVIASVTSGLSRAELLSGAPGA